jgi:hypothetical protein
MAYRDVETNDGPSQVRPYLYSCAPSIFCRRVLGVLGMGIGQSSLPPSGLPLEDASNRGPTQTSQGKDTEFTAAPVPNTAPTSVGFWASRSLARSPGRPGLLRASLAFGAAARLRLPPHMASRSCSCLQLVVATNSLHRGLALPFQGPCLVHQGLDRRGRPPSRRRLKKLVRAARQTHRAQTAETGRESINRVAESMDEGFSPICYPLVTPQPAPGCETPVLRAFPAQVQLSSICDPTLRGPNGSIHRGPPKDLAG